ncbi:hypothetical protein [Jeotgalibacillus sp. JSM ZJ347]|uniref:hypothetical protein n=1 Tax=Jeotgalibacillus sp. JSM ZJ347 TaxID=3342117 RepID=UPI0035A95A5D
MVLSLSSGESASAPSSGYKNGDELTKAKALYVDHGYTYWEMGLGKATVYTDQENKISLMFWSQEDETISGIWLSGE